MRRVRATHREPDAAFHTPYDFKRKTMAQPTTSDKIPVTLHLSPDVARRLKAAAEAQKRLAADLAAELLDRHLPRPQTAGPKKGSIPYS
jgi:hypothetical protein